jgi:hypothetical protein
MHRPLCGQWTSDFIAKARSPLNSDEGKIQGYTYMNACDTSMHDHICGANPKSIHHLLKFFSSNFLLFQSDHVLGKHTIRWILNIPCFHTIWNMILIVYILD